MMIQDVMVPQQLPLEQAKLKMVYHVSGKLETGSKYLCELKIRPDSISTNPLFYFGFDIAHSLKPTLADLSFVIVNQFGFAEDSLVFARVRMNGDSGLYISKSFHTEIQNPTILFSAIKPAYDLEGYALFRQEIAEIDEYFASASLLDSLRTWSGENFPAGEDSYLNFFLQQFELSRIVQYLGDPFPKGLQHAIPDPAGVADRLEQAHRLQIRANTILKSHSSRSGFAGIPGNLHRMVSSWAEWVIAYDERARNTDHRRGDFYAGLSVLDLPAGRMHPAYTLIKDESRGFLTESQLRSALRMSALSAAGLFERNGEISQAFGDYVLALRWYGNALEICHAVPGAGRDSLISARVLDLKMEMAASYLRLARSAAARSPMTVTESYLSKARELIADLPSLTAGYQAELNELQHQVYSAYCLKAGEFIGAGKYLLALDYLYFLQEKCEDCLFECSGDIQRLTLDARTGRYAELLQLAKSSYDAGDPGRCREYLSDALEIRLTAGSRIPRDRLEAELSVSLDQDIYDDLLEEGTRFLNYHQYDVALYYLNKARAMEPGRVLQSDPSLPEKLQEAARPLILGMIETGRARAMGYFFAESWEMLHSSRKMISGYGMENDPQLAWLCTELETYLRDYQCEKTVRDYYEALLQAQKQKAQGEYIAAQDMIRHIIETVKADTVCSVNDQEAWYLKAWLEYPAEFMRKQNQSLGYIPADPQAFVKSYQELEKYYLFMRLDTVGVVFVPMHQRIMMETDAGFLTQMVEYYYRQKNRQPALEVLMRLWTECGAAPPPDLQKGIAAWLAGEDILHAGSIDPLECLETCVPSDNAFRSFRIYYKFYWLKYSGWKVRYFSLFLKVKTADSKPSIQ